ncbi:sugar ABC transporter ATP-binding protein [Bacillus pacificus]|uniref:sugar ABC transporter ATP-binding protein n=1 Tax=Bacillus cereus group TaxID=86661 RepID=UPI000772472A|nr:MULTISPECIES: sugar ABC transporter ATP-binding protein [Bacillus cereus group]KXI53322.1 sugar ABC transporter ATP-binding protein [Bacillus cereus]KYP99170.1 Autoinducer 2 (AI-2) ABC transport system fused AI2 transporter subunits and ATP-binding component [Bacillus cereus]MCC2352604.1 sugar ABC transporter ATP-binding protein [Bacillus pacificus]MCC2465995.1 sugar ABC transporter ATP-binding protein [Bacillus pacificus]MCU5247277.1 sugar ABC transporter ATP-binding protein [Bacillus paci
MENVPLLQVNKMSKAFSNQLVLKEVNLQVERGDIYALVGGNGAGKSTLMKILTGLYSYDDGEMYVKGTKQQFSNPSEAHRKGIYLIPQEPLIFPHMTIKENICIGLTEKKKKLRVQIEQLINSLGWDINLNELGGSLSIAQQQLVEIVRGLIREAEILILDEPTSTLTTHEIKSLFVLMKSLQEKGIGMIYITHRFPEIFEIANKVAILRDGMIVSQGDVCDYTYDMLMEGLLPKGYKQKEKIEVVQETARTKKILEVIDITSHAFKNISFTVHAGEIVGVAGIIGSGRTELAEAIFGLKTIKSGSILLEGKSIDACSLHKRLEKGLVYVPEDRARNGIFSIASVKENIAAANLQQNNRFFINQEKESALVNSFIEQFRIVVQNMNEELVSLSGGNQQKVVLAKYLACNPKIIILDEPTRGIDAKARIEVYETIEKMKREGLAILLISSDVEEIVQLVNRVYVMRNGRFVSYMEKEQLSVNEVTRLAHGGVAE